MLRTNHLGILGERTDVSDCVAIIMPIQENFYRLNFIQYSNVFVLLLCLSVSVSDVANNENPSEKLRGLQLKALRDGCTKKGSTRKTQTVSDWK